jgi:hypothetical protein
MQGLRETYGSLYGYTGPRTGATFKLPMTGPARTQWRGAPGSGFIPEGDYGSLNEALAAGKKQSYQTGTLPKLKARDVINAIRGKDWNPLFKAGTGLDYAELNEQGLQHYPDIPAGSKHHAEGARRLTETLRPYLGRTGSFLAGQGAGLGLEAAEYLLGDPSSLTGATLRDLGANLVGGMEGAGFRQKNQPLEAALLSQK